MEDMRRQSEQIYDDILAIRCQQGDTQAFDQIVAKWQKHFWQYAYRVTGSEAAAWDIVQETWLGIINGLMKQTDVSAFDSWSFGILNNKCIDWLRKEQRLNKTKRKLSKQNQGQLSNTKNKSEATILLEAAIEKIPYDSRALLTLRYSEGLSIPQIAEVLRKPEGTIKSHLHRIVQQLRQQMERKLNG